MRKRKRIAYWERAAKERLLLFPRIGKRTPVRGHPRYIMPEPPKC